MKNYDPNITRGMHVVKITLQQWEYKGHIIRRVCGNCKGRSVIDFDFFCGDDFTDNDCQIKYHEENDYFTCTLKDENGNTLKCDGDANEMNDMIVAVEIVDYVEE